MRLTDSSGGENEARGLRRRRRAVSHADPAVALHLAVRPPRPASAACCWRPCCCSPPSSPPSRCRSPSNGRSMRWPGRAARRSRRHPGSPGRSRRRSPMTLAYGGMRVLMAVLTQVRDGLFAKVAMHAVRRLAHPHLRAHAPAVAALPSRAQDRRADARARARTQRIETIVRMVILQLLPTIVELALIVGVLLCQFDWRYVLVDPGHGRALHVVHLYRDRMAHRHPPPDERQRHRRQHQGDQLAAQLRDGEIFRRRGARGAALRPLDGALRGRAA